MRLYLIRHGQTVANQKGILQGQLDYPLSVKGKAEAEALGKWLSKERINHIYSSDLERAYETAEEINKYHQLHIKMMTNLREWRFGLFEGLTRKQIKEKFPQYADLDWVTEGVEGVEQVEEMRERVQMVLKEIHHHHGQKQERIAVVNHYCS